MNPGGPRGFNSLRKYLSLDSTVGENINPWIQQSNIGLWIQQFEKNIDV